MRLLVSIGFLASLTILLAAALMFGDGNDIAGVLMIVLALVGFSSMLRLARDQTHNETVAHKWEAVKQATDMSERPK